MTNKERKKYIINRCYSAHYAKLPEAFKQINILRYPGLWLSIFANTELFNIQNLTPECTDVLLTTKKSGGSYEANLENLDYTLHVFYELNYVIDKMRFIGDDSFIYPNLTHIIKVILREMPKIKHIEIISDGNTVPDDEIIDILRNPGMTAVIYSSGTKLNEIIALFEERSVNYEICDKPVTCSYCKNTHTVFVEGKIFRCPIAAYNYANKGEGTEDKDFVDIVARKLSIKNLRLAMFDITNDPPPADCKSCKYNIK